MILLPLLYECPHNAVIPPWDLPLAHRVGHAIRYWLSARYLARLIQLPVPLPTRHGTRSEPPPGSALARDAGRNLSAENFTSGGGQGIMRTQFPLYLNQDTTMIDKELDTWKAFIEFILSQREQQQA